MTELSKNKWDIFISHASEDKKEFVSILSETLTRFGLKVWYDEYELKIGDSLSRSIDDGLSKSDYGLIILSKDFFAKRWPERELSGLVSREMLGKKVILPIWRGVKFQDVVEYSPTLADKFAINSDEISINQLAIKIIETIKPNIFQKIQRRISYFEQLKKSEIATVSINRLKKSPIRHENLPEEIISRIRLIRASLLGVYSQSMKYWLEGFKRDSHPSKEITHWEHVASVYQEYIKMTPDIKTPEQHKEIFSYISNLWNDKIKNKKEFSSIIPKNAMSVINDLYYFQLPIYDIVDEDIDMEEDSYFENETMDIEIFPYDLPDDLIKDIMKK